jgi:hypothetical protein
VRGGTYVVMEGPQFSTKAESALAPGSAADVIGMTNMPEAKLAREAELCYATVAMVTDFDCWHPGSRRTSTSTVMAVLANAAAARSLSPGAADARRSRTAVPHGCDRALDHALLTAPEARDPGAGRASSTRSPAARRSLGRATMKVDGRWRRAIERADDGGAVVVLDQARCRFASPGCASTISPGPRGRSATCTCAARR